MSQARSPALRRPRWWTLAAAALVLAATFSLYVHPDFMLQMAQQLWFCFQ